MVQNAQSYAHQFTSEESVRNKIIELKSHYKGITNWDVDIVEPNDSDNHNVPKQPIHQIFKPVKKQGEYVIRWVTNGKTDENKTYYTDDKADANATYLMMVKNAEELNKKI